MTGIPAATLRAWERRYGVPAPARSASAYRLYDDAEVEKLRRMRELIDGGIATAEAARLVLEAAPAVATAEARDPWTHAADRIVQAALDFDGAALDDALRSARTFGSAASLYDRILGPALHRIGDLWHEGAIGVAQEHLASQAIESTVRGLLALVQPQAPRRSVILGCFADESHSIGLYGAALHFAGWGFRTVLFGARTPPSAIAQAVDTLNPQLVGLSLTVVPPRRELRTLLEDYAIAAGRTPWIVGGPGAAAAAEAVRSSGGLSLSGELATARPVIESLLAVRARRLG